MKHESLLKLLATTYSLYAKTQNYHWNVRGLHFFHVHKFLEGAYTSKIEVLDEIAERVAQLGQKVPATLKTYTELSLIKEGNHELSMPEMMKDLVESHKTIIDFINKIMLEYQSDVTTTDLLTRRLSDHEKEAWLINSMLDS